MKQEYILSLSYGKDSLACLGAIEQLGLPLDRIIHAEVWATDKIPADLPPMVEFKKKADAIIKERYGIEVERVRSKDGRRKERQMKVEILKYPTTEDWLLVKKCTLVTVGKETNKPATEKFKRDMLRARHSPIRELRFLFYLTDIPYWVSVHLCRHVHAQPYVKTQRNDRQSAYDRETAPQNAPVDMMWSVNGEELITIANKRLCNLASKETKKLVQMICNEVVKVCPEFKEELVPMCARNGGVCYEMFPCGERKNNGQA